MGLLETVSETVSADRSRADAADAPETFAYRCDACGERFELPKTRMTAVHCPDCGSGRVLADD